MMEQLEKYYLKYIELSDELSKPEISSNFEKVKEIQQELRSLEQFALVYEKWKKLKEDLEEAKNMLKSESDPELKEFAEEEVEKLQKKIMEVESEAREAIITSQGENIKNAIVEIRAGAGGEEAALFAGDLFRMYSRYAERKGFEVEILSTHRSELGGFKEIVFMVKGKGAYGLLRYESGVHRVQRVPVTESGGRIHTSTATVAVLPEAKEVEVEVNPSDLQIETFRSSGPGGQHVNVTDSAVRITHIPTGISVTCRDERSQHQNRAKAMAILRARLLELERRKQQEKIHSMRRSQVGTGERSEKIRTYNFPQNRVTDHRINFTVNELDSILDGEIDPIIEKLLTHHLSEESSP